MNLELPAISKQLKNTFETNELKQNSVVSKMEATAADGKNYQTNELKEVATISILETVQKEGNRNVKRNFINEIKLTVKKPTNGLLSYIKMKSKTFTSAKDILTEAKKPDTLTFFTFFMTT